MFSVQNISQSYERILMIFVGEVKRDPENNLLEFGGAPDFFRGS